MNIQDQEGDKDNNKDDDENNNDQEDNSDDNDKGEEKTMTTITTIIAQATGTKRPLQPMSLGSDSRWILFVRLPTPSNL